jgi:hypothetical protein
VSRRPGLLGAEAHRFDLPRGHAEQRQRALDRIRPALAERQVVLAAAALVAVALDPDLEFLVFQQELGVRLHDRLELVADVVHVEVVVDAALGQRARRVLELRSRVGERFLAHTGRGQRLDHRLLRRAPRGLLLGAPLLLRKPPALLLGPPGICGTLFLGGALLIAHVTALDRGALTGGGAALAAATGDQQCDEQCGEKSCQSPVIHCSRFLFSDWIRAVPMRARARPARPR